MTIAELIVVMAIIGVITSIIVFNHQDFRDQLSLENDVQEIALVLRQAQVFGLGVREAEGVASFDLGYGVHFNEGEKSEYSLYYYEVSDSADPGADDRFFDAENIIEPLSLSNSNEIIDVCGIRIDTSNEQCWSEGLPSMVIAFERPRPDAFMYIYNNDEHHELKQVTLTVESPRGRVRNVVVDRQTGHISIEN